MGSTLSLWNRLTPEGYALTRRHTVAFLHPGPCQLCYQDVPVRFTVRDREKKIGSVCGTCAMLVSLGHKLKIQTTCRGCGCTDSAGCLVGCWWVELDRATGTGLCSNCAGKP